MRAFVLALVLWSAVVLTWILIVPVGNGGLLGCMHLVGRSVACETQQNAINQSWWDNQTLPTLATIAAGYIAIVIVRLVRLRRRPRPDLLG
jgi:hypothetical protein